jgi:hypothetical protein
MKMRLSSALCAECRRMNMRMTVGEVPKFHVLCVHNEYNGSTLLAILL